MPNTSRNVVVFLLISVLVTCGGLTRVSATQTATATIPGGSLLDVVTGDLGFGNLGNFDISQSQEFKNQGIKREQINSVKLKSLTLTITSPANGQDFTFLQSLAFFVEAPGVEKKEIARGGPFTAGAKEVSLTLLDVELAPYATATSMTFTTTANGKKPGSTTTVEAKVILDADVNVAGVICGSK
jgi:hypothetical protein